MNLRVILFALTMAGFSTLAKGQDLNTYQWNHRLVLLLTADSNQAQFQEQLALFDKDKDGLVERKLKIISATPSHSRSGSKAWGKNAELYQKYHRKGDFEFILIGLDGGVKLRRSDLMSLKALYRIIDSMPMRAAEMRRKNN